MLLLIIPFLMKPINGLYDIGELESLRAYCYLHADRAAQGENVVNDLIKAGLANSTYNDWSCSKIKGTLEAEERRIQAEEYNERQRELEYVDDCKYGNLTPSQYWECDDAGYKPHGIICLFEQDREEAKKRISEGFDFLSLRIDLDFAGPPDLSLAEPLTPAEQLECKNTDNGPLKVEDKDNKESDK
jgi:hypothetical protein